MATQRHVLTASIGLGLGIAAGSMIAHGAPGTLHPPSGNVEGTMHTLDEIFDKVSANELQLATLTNASGPWEYHTEVPGNDTQLDSQQIVPGRVLLHAIISNIGDVLVFDGPGQIDGNGNPDLASANNLAAFARSNQIGPGGSGSAYSFSVQNTVNIELDNGLHVAWRSDNSPQFSFTILYRELDP